jgi:hypothetical protein
VTGSRGRVAAKGSYDAAVRKLFGWMAGLAGIAALARIVAARRAGVATRSQAPATSAPDADPAEALRRKLSAARKHDAAASASTTTASGSTETLEERRARVHAKAQEAMDAMDALQEPPT